MVSLKVISLPSDPKPITPLTESPVDRLSGLMDRGILDKSGKYQDRIPLGMPGEGEQFAFEVDLDLCTGCKACVAACHTLNGLDADESWRGVGVLVGQGAAGPGQQHITSSCHHCVEPGCLQGCPALAYDKDPLTGIVRHLDDQCIGCQYCLWTCPYDAPSYHADKGIVRKCDMCHGRLVRGEAPACVQACPAGAITIRVIAVQNIHERAAAGEFLPTAAGPERTGPSTTYVSKKGLALSAGGAAIPLPGKDQPSLVAALLATQWAVGLLVLSLLAGLAGAAGVHGNLLVYLAAGVCLAGVLAGPLHLGRPLMAWRAILGW